MLVQPLQAATVCELDLVQHAIRSWKRAQTLDPRQPPDNCHEPLNRTLDAEHAHVSGHSCLVQVFGSSNGSIISTIGNRLRTADPDLSAGNGEAETWWKPVIASEDKTGREAPKPVIRGAGWSHRDRP
jgi:hypothetical protein